MKKTSILTGILMVMITIASVAQENVEKEKFYFSKTLTATMDEATQQVKASLKEEGFGIVTEIDMHKTLEEKLGKTMNTYRILGACNARFAWQTLQKEENIGVFLPCKVLVKDVGGGKTEVVAVNPSQLMEMLNNPELEGIADEVTSRFKNALEKL
ncbi:MAG: DUF302 domain-containing protein [Bacteroidales bacterium]|nr:DUF302 domain-containing protein [Bacteroidales bacterium]